MKLIICSACLDLRKCEKHYLFPQHKKNKKAPVVFLCPKCIKELHRLLPPRKLSKEQYVRFIQKFIEGERNAMKFDFIHKERHYVPQFVGGDSYAVL